MKSTWKETFVSSIVDPIKFIFTAVAVMIGGLAGLGIALAVLKRITFEGADLFTELSNEAGFSVTLTDLILTILVFVVADRLWKIEEVLKEIKNKDARQAFERAVDEFGK